MTRLLCLGLGYSAQRVAKLLADRGWQIAGTARTAEGAEAIAALGYRAFVFGGTAPSPQVAGALREATHVLVSAAPDSEGDPLLSWHWQDLLAATSLSWIGYLSTIGVYGDAGGAWIDETAPAVATSVRGRQRVAAENAWLDVARRRNVRIHVLRLAGIYGPGRSAIDRLRAGTAHRIVKPGQVFNRIHVDDIAQAVLAGIDGAGTHAVYNVADDEPAPPQDVVAFAAGLLGVPAPPEVAFEQAELSPMARSFYADNKRVSNARLRQDLGVDLKFPSYREGLHEILAAETTTPVAG